MVEYGRFRMRNGAGQHSVLITGYLSMRGTPKHRRVFAYLFEDIEIIHMGLAGMQTWMNLVPHQEVVDCHFFLKTGLAHYGETCDQLAEIHGRKPELMVRLTRSLFTKQVGSGRRPDSARWSTG